MNEQRIRQIIREEIFRDNNKSRFVGVQSIQDHIHNGVDAPRISQDDLVNGTANNSLIVMNENETFQLKNVQGISRITFHGFAADNADGSPATQRALINGTVVFGTCLRFTGSGSVISPEGAGNTTAFTQGTSSIYTLNQVDAIRVSSSSDHFAYVTDGSTEVAKASVVAVSVDSISIRVELASNWQITGSLILT